MIRNVSLLALALTAMLGLPSGGSAQAKTITFLGKTADTTNYSSTGMNIGKAGFWFPQFNASTAGGGVTGQLTDDNDRNSLPSWALMNFTRDFSDPTRTFSLDSGGVYSEGGDPAWNLFTLPDDEVGLSGSVVDPQTKNNSNNTVNKIILSAGVPQSFLLHIVVDNTNGEHDPASRLEARAETPAIDNRINTTVADFNGIADVYTFKYDGWLATDFIKLRLNSGVIGEAAGFAGLMFDVVPEPTSVSIVLLGAASLLCGPPRRRRC